MTVGIKHVPSDRLTALALVTRPAETEQDERALSHIARCDECAAELARLTAQADGLRNAAFDRADAIFDDPVLDAQRTRILDRLATLGQAARVLRFPLRTREAAMPVSRASRRWISVAAAAGLIIGLVAGQLLQFLPWDGATRRDGALTLQSVPRSDGGGTVAVAGTGSAVTDDQFLNEIEATVHLRRAHSLRTLDALTPTAGEFRDFPLGQR
jgi:hypothetical protein